jgi:hypothetical protein
MLSSSVSNPSSPAATSNPVAPDERRPSPVDAVLDYLSGDPARFAPRPIQPQDLGRAAVVFDIGTAPPTPTLDRWRAYRQATNRKMGDDTWAGPRRPRWPVKLARALQARRRATGRMLTEAQIYKVMRLQRVIRRPHRPRTLTFIEMAWLAELDATPHLPNDRIYLESDRWLAGFPGRALGTVNQHVARLSLARSPDDDAPQRLGLGVKQVYPLAQLLERFSGHSNLSSVSQRGEDAESPKGSPAPSAAKRPQVEGVAQ